MLYDVGDLIPLRCQARHCELCHFLTNNSPQKKPKKIMKKTYILTSMLALAMAGSVQAQMTAGQTVGIDFGGVAPTDGVAPTNDFNEAAGVTGSIAAGSLIDITGGAITGTSFAWASTANSPFANLDAAAQGGEPAVFDDSNLTDWLGGAGGNQLITLTFSGLDQGLTYDLLIGNSFGSAVPTSTYTADGQFATNDPTIGSAAFVSLNGLSADINGDLVITVTNGGELVTAVSALTLTAIPEPGTYALFAGALALTSVMVRRRR